MGIYFHPKRKQICHRAHVPEYALASLSSRSFEQLVQALAQRVLGPDTAVFGDGADGGREASLTRSARDPEWRGTTFIQAKFRQKPTTPSTDATWAVDQLRRELRKFAPIGKRAAPDNFVYATNVRLTAVDGVGGRDRLEAVFPEFAAKGLRFKKHAIWGYDEIRGFLDGAADIRAAYAAFLTTGDVISALVQGLDLTRDDFYDALSAYIEKQFVSDHYVNLDQAGSLGDGIPLARVALDLPFDTDPSALEVGPDEGRDQPKIVEYLLAVGDEPVAKVAGDARRSTRSAGRFVVVGGPGQGKSTVGQLLSQLYRAAILRDLPTASPHSKAALDAVLERCAGGELRLPVARRIPIRVSLKSLAEDLADGSARGVLDFMARSIQGRTLTQVNPADLLATVRAYSFVFIFDGLDEVPATANRSDVLQSITDFLVDLDRRRSDSIVIATTRPQGYTKEFSSDLFEHVYLTPLPSDDAERVATLLLAQRFPGDDERQGTIVERVRRAIREPQTAKLARSPLQVTILTTLLELISEPPRERWQLFSQYYEVIFRREAAKELANSNLLRDYGTEVSAIHRWAALYLEVRLESGQHIDAVLTKDELSTIARLRLVQEGHSDDTAERLADELVRLATDRLVFLVPSREGVFSFEVRSLQEFMVAEALMDGADDDVRTRLRMIAAGTQWRNAFLFAAGRCFADRQHLRDGLLALCAELNEADELRAITREGSHLALDLLHDGAVDRQPGQAKSLARIAVRALEIGDQEAATRLADATTPITAEVIIGAALSQLAQSDDAVSAWTTLLSGAERVPDLFEDALRQALQDPLPRSLIQTALRMRLPPTIVSRIADQMRRLSPAIALCMRESWGRTSSPVVEHWKRNAPTRLRLLLELRDDLLRATHEIRTASWSTYVSARANIVSVDQFAPTSVAALDVVAEDPVGAGVVEFLREPNSAGLLACLEVLASSTGAQLELAQWRGLPWPVDACFAALRGGTEIGALVAAARAGRLGERDDWIAAEQRWLTDGIRIDDLEHSAQSELPISASIRDVGYPGGAENFTYFILESRTPDRSAVERLLRLPSGSQRSLAMSLLAGPWVEGVDPDVRRQITRAALENESPMLELPVGVLDVESIRQDRTLASHLGRKLHMSSSPTVSTSFIFNIFQFLEHDHDESLLRLLALVDAPRLERAEVPTHLTMPGGGVMGSLAHINLVEASEEEVRSAIALAADAEPDLAGSILLRRYSSSTFIGSCLRALPLNRRTANEVRRLLSREPAGLHDEAGWRAARLPEELGVQLRLS